jgi:hypothetical protein
MSVPIFSVFCIDFRYDNLTANFFQGVGFVNSYFAATAAGAALPLGYKCSCSEICKKGKCDPKNEDMTLLRENLVKNLEIALTLQPIERIYLLNHQDCGAIKAFLPWSGYPKVLGENNKKEIIINSKLLTYAANYIKRVFPDIKLTLGIVDINGTIATYNIHTKVWTVIYIGKYNLSSGLWHGLVVGDVNKN